MLISELRPEGTAAVRRIYFETARAEARADAANAFRVVSGIRCAPVRVFEDIVREHPASGLQLAFGLIDRAESGHYEDLPPLRVQEFDAKLRQSRAVPATLLLKAAALREFRKLLRKGIEAFGRVLTSDADGVVVERDAGMGFVVRTYLTFGTKAKLAKLSHAIDLDGRRLVGNINILSWRGLNATTDLMEDGGLPPDALAAGLVECARRFDDWMCAPLVNALASVLAD